MSLEKLSPPVPRIISVAGRDIALTPVRMGQLSAFSKAVSPAAGLILAGQLMEAVTGHYDDLRAALVVAAGVEADWVDALMPDDFVRLCEAVVEVNAAFFVQRLTPVILATQARMAQAVGQIGERSSPSLDATATT